MQKNFKNSEFTLMQKGQNESRVLFEILVPNQKRLEHPHNPRGSPSNSKINLNSISVFFFRNEGCPQVYRDHHTQQVAGQHEGGQSDKQLDTRTREEPEEDGKEESL